MNRRERRAAGIKSKSRYSTRCYSCFTTFDFSPSQQMLDGHNHGYGRCPRCGLDLELKIVNGLEVGISNRWRYDKPPT